MMNFEHSIWIIGAGHMGTAYTEVLQFLGQKPLIITRGRRNADLIHSKLKCEVYVGSVLEALATKQEPELAIVAVNTINTVSVLKNLIKIRNIRILVEKPGFLGSNLIDEFINKHPNILDRIHIGYNRKYYQSVDALKHILEEDKASSISFNFTELSHVVSQSNYPKAVKEKWVIENSSHIIDLFIHLAGAWPDEEKTKFLSTGSLKWHTSASIFLGHGITDNNVLFSYNADWNCPGRWSIECKTPRTSYLLKPLESLSQLKLGEMVYTPVELDYSIDKQFKPGIFNQCKAFISNKTKNLNSLTKQRKIITLCEKIGNYR